MSGGKLNYIFSDISDTLCGRMEDIELNDLIKDISELVYDLEWYLSGDTNGSTYKEAVHKFKQKWFKQDRQDRLKEYVDVSLNKVKEELYSTIDI